MQEKSLIKKNILKFIEYKGITKYSFYKITGITRGVLDQNNGMSEENTAKFLAAFPEVSVEWLILDVPPMLRCDISRPIENQVSSPEPPIVDNNSIGFILDRYELVVSENALLKKENEELKLSRGNPINNTTYPISKKIGSHIAAEPGAHKHT